MTRQKIVAGNWKMNGSKESITTLVNSLLETESFNSEVVVLPPFPYLHLVSLLINKSSIVVAAQNVSDKTKGAFTGEVSASMLKDFGIKYVLVGHSERRSLYAENDTFIVLKIKALLASGLMPMFCIGETLEERNSNRTLSVCKKQLQAVLDEIGIDAFAKLVIAYEPVWAIGTRHSASAQQAQRVHQSIRSFLAKFSKSVAEKIQILYGGSVSSSASIDLFSMPDVDGVLVGSASLNINEFIKIVRIAS